MFTIHSCCSIVRPSNLMYFDVTSFVLVHVREKRWVARYTMFVRSSGAQLNFAGCVECIWMHQTLFPRMLSSWWLGAKKRLWSQCFWNSLFSAHFQLILCTDGVFSYLFSFGGKLSLAFCSFWLSWIFTQEAVQTRFLRLLGMLSRPATPSYLKCRSPTARKSAPPILPVRSVWA